MSKVGIKYVLWPALSVKTRVIGDGTGRVVWVIAYSEIHAVNIARSKWPHLFPAGEPPHQVEKVEAGVVSVGDSGWHND